jgi:diguanylate cyclase (GGDEF)-like protein
VHGSAAAVFQDLATEDEARAIQAALGFDTVSVLPLEAAGERLGVLIMMCPGAPDRDVAKLFAAHVSCAIVNLRQTQAARDTGVIDVVRSVFDARKIENDLQRELARAERYKREVSIVVIEATNLRLLRERFGTFLTDRLLQRLGESLAQNSREIDVIGAYKESGYTMILTEASTGAAELACRRLLASTRYVAIDGDAVPGLELHLAAGWASFPTDGSSTEGLFQASERRMYGADAERVA